MNEFLLDKNAPESSMGIDQVSLLRKILINSETTQIRLVTERLFD